MSPTRVLWVVVAVFWLAGCGLAVDTDERIERASAALAAGDARTALLEARRALQSEPNRGDARLVVATALFQGGDIAGAAQEYSQAVGLGSSSLVLERNLLLAQGRYDDLLANLDANPTADDEAVLLRAAALVGKADYDTALTVLQELKRTRPEHVAAGNAIASVYLARGDTSLALAELAGMESYAGGDRAYWRLKGMALLTTGRYEEAATALRRADEIGGAAGWTGLDPALLAAIVQADLGRGNLEEAAASVAKLAAMVPDAPATLMVSAQVAAARGNDTDAASLLQRLVADDPRNDSAHLLLGRVLLRQGRFRQALAEFRAVLSRHPEHSGARMLAAATQMRLDQPGEALATLEPLLTLGTPDSALFELAGSANLLAGNVAQANELFSRSSAQRGEVAFEEGTDYAEERARIAMHLSSGDRASAEAAIDQLLNEHPGDVAALTLASRAYQRLGDLGRAEELLRQAVSTDTPDVATYSSLIRMLVASGDAVEAARLTETLRAGESAFTDRERLEVWNLMAMAGDAEAAAARLLAVEGQDAEVIRAQLTAARYLVRRGYPDLSQALIDKLPATLAPADRAAAGAIALSIGLPDRARALFDAAAESAPGEPEFAIGEALAYLELGQRQSAREVLQSLLADRPDFIPALVLLARVQQTDGDSAGAFATVAKVRELEPRGAVADGLSGYLLQQQGNFAAAAEAYRSALSKEPSRGLVVNAFHAAVEANLAEPTAVLEDWLAANDRDAAVRALLAQHYLVVGQEERARANYERLMAGDGENALYANNLAWLYLDSDVPRAVELAQRAYAAAPNSMAVADTLGWALVKAGRSSEAVPLLRRAATLDEVEVRYHLAVALAETNANSEAKALFEQVAASDVKPEILQDTQQWLQKL